jgi:hypothetical protein
MALVVLIPLVQRLEKHKYFARVRELDVSITAKTQAAAWSGLRTLLYHFAHAVELDKDVALAFDQDQRDLLQRIIRYGVSLVRPRLPETILERYYKLRPACGFTMVLEGELTQLSVEEICEMLDEYTNDPRTKPSVACQSGNYGFIKEWRTR